MTPGGWAAPSETNYDVPQVGAPVDEEGEPFTQAIVALIPAESDPIFAASSEQPSAHMTTVFLGEVEDIPNFDEVEQAVRLYAQDLSGPVVAPVTERGTLGDDGADVVFVERTDALVALRDGLLANEAIRVPYEAAEQFPEWTTHVTLGYPERPARGEYDATEVTFDRIALWWGGEQYVYAMGGTVSDTTIAAGGIVAEDEPQTVIVGEDGPEGVVPLDGEDDPDEELITEIPVHGVDVIEGRPTGDGRSFDVGAVSYAPFPQPLGFEFESSHGGNNSRVAVIGRVDEAWAFQREDGIVEQRWRGVVMPAKPYASQAIEGIIDGSYSGLSVIIDEITVNAEATNAAYDSAAEGETVVTHIRSAQVRRRDMVPTGAYHQGYVGLGAAFEDEISDDDRAALAACGCAEGPADFDLANAKTVDLTEMTPEQLAEYDAFATEGEQIAYAESLGLVASAAFAPGTKDGPGWITNPLATSRIRRYWTHGEGAAKIRWGVGGDFNRCRQQLAKYVPNPEWLAGLCANMHYEVLGFWPAQHAAHSLTASAETVEDQEIALVASASRTFPAEAFKAPDQGRAFAMQIDRQTRTITGYAAQWGTCHIGITGMCKEAPRSKNNYANFRKGSVMTDQGEQEVALITYGIGHADPRVNASVATAHYDRTDAVRAYINIGEDAYGIWYSGVLAPWVTDDDIDAMMAIRRVSGDWRNHTGRYGELEMVGLVVVNTDGYQLAASAALDGMIGGVQTSAIGIGAVDVENEPLLASAGETHEQFVARVAVEVRRQLAFAARVDAARSRVKTMRRDDARRRIEEMV